MISGFLEFMGRYIALTEDEKARLSEILEVRTYDKKAKLTDLGEVEQYLNFVVNGLIRKFFFNGKDQVIKHIAKEGNILASSVSYFSRLPSNYIVETLEPSVVVSISRDNLEKLFQSDERWERAGRLMMADLLIEKEYWLLNMARYSPRERFLQFIKEQPDLVQRVPQKYLASYLHIKPETFSRLKHLVQIKNNIIKQS
jgi:CRP-like cAMP-binding protein